MVFSVCLQCLRWHPLRTKNIHCIQFSVCFGSHALRTKNIHCIQPIYARPSGVNICSLQIEHRSAASFSIGAIGTNGSIGEDFLTIGICLCVLDMCDFSTTARRVTSPTWGPPPPCKQALRETAMEK